MPGLKVRGGRIVRRHGPIITKFCDTCPEMEQLSAKSPNGDENLERLSRHLSKLNLRAPKKSKKKRNYIKF